MHHEELGIFTMAELKKEITSKITNELEWHYEQTGEIADFNQVLETIEKEMREERFTEEAIEILNDEAEPIFEEVAEEIEDSILNMEALDPDRGKTFYDIHNF